MTFPEYVVMLAHSPAFMLGVGWLFFTIIMLVCAEGRRPR